MYKLSVSEGNSKMGKIKSISLPRVGSCNPAIPCYKTCYVKHIEWRTRVLKSYQNNLDLFLYDPESFEQQALLAAFGSTHFRWHVSGDILNKEYLAMMCRIAERLNVTQFLAFTKKYDIVNKFVEEGGTVPTNLHIIFSEWPGLKMDNPHNFPVSFVKFKSGVCDAPANSKTCSGNCEMCAFAGQNCWTIKKGESIVLNEH